MLNKVQMKYMIAMKLLEDVLKGDNVDRAQAFSTSTTSELRRQANTWRKLRTHGQFDLFEVGD